MNKRKLTSLLLAISISLSAGTLTSCSSKKFTRSNEKNNTYKITEDRFPKFKDKDQEEKTYKNNEVIIVDTSYEDENILKDGIEKRFILLGIEDACIFNDIEGENIDSSIISYKDLNNEEFKALFKFSINTKTNEYTNYLFAYNSEQTEDIYYFATALDFKMSDLGWFYTPNMLLTEEQQKEEFKLSELQAICNMLNEKEETRKLQKNIISL